MRLTVLSPSLKSCAMTASETTAPIVGETLNAKSPPASVEAKAASDKRTTVTRLLSPMIQIEGLRFGYRDGEDVVRIDDFAVEAQENVLIVGPSGCGKTTLLHLIAGLLLPRAGKVVVDGQDLAAMPSSARDRFRGRHIGIVLQQFHLLPTLTALQNLLVAQTIPGPAADPA